MLHVTTVDNNCWLAKGIFPVLRMFHIPGLHNVTNTTIKLLYKTFYSHLLSVRNIRP